MQLYKIRRKLDRFEDDLEVVLEDDKYIGKEYGSDRGSYIDMYIQEVPDYDNENRIRTVKEFKEMIDKAYKQKEMTGYKGGTFVIDDETYVKVGYYGVGGNPLIEDIVKENNKVVIKLRGYIRGVLLNLWGEES